MKIITLLFLISQLSYSQISPTEVETINNNLENIDAPETRFKSQNCCSTESDLKQTMLQCAMDLCGSPKDVNSVYITNEYFEDSIKDPLIEKDFLANKNELNEVLEKEQNKLKEIIKRIKNNLTNPNYLNIEKLDNQQVSTLSSNILRDNTYIEVTRNEGSKEIKVDLWDEKIKSSFPKTLEIYEEHKKKEFLGSFYDKIYNDYYTFDEAKEYILQMRKVTIETLEKIKQSSPSNYELYQNVIAMITEDSISNVEEIENFGGLFSRLNEIINNVNVYLDEPITDYYGYNEEFACNEDICREELQAYINSYELETLIGKFENNLNLPSNNDDYINQCKNTWYVDKTLSVPEENKEQILKELPQIKERILKNFISPLSEDSQLKLTEYLNNLQHHFGIENTPNSGEDRDDPLSELKTFISEYEVNEDDSYDFIEDSEKIYHDLTAIDDFLDFSGEINIAGELDDYCTKQLFLADDYFYPTTDEEEKVYVHSSNFSCEYYTQGKQIITHEFGHAISHLFSQKQTSEESYQYYLNTRQCVSSNYLDIETKGLLIDHAGDNYYSEEDFADYLAFNIYPEEKNKLLFCSLLKPTESNESWDLEDLAIVHDDILDPHSTPLTRAIMEAIYKNIIPSLSCKNLMDHYQDKIRFNKCE